MRAPLRRLSAIAAVWIGPAAALVDAEEGSANRVTAEAFSGPETFGGLEAFNRFCGTLRSAPGAPRDAQAKAARTLLIASDRFLAELGAAEGSATNDRERSVAWQRKLIALQGLVTLGDKSAPDRLAAALQEAGADRSQGVRHAAWRHGVTQELTRWKELSEAEANALIDRIGNGLSAGEPTNEQLVFLYQLLFRFNPLATPPMEPRAEGRHIEDYPRELLTALADWLPERSDDPETQGLLTEILSSRRRIMLPGQKIDLSGVLLDGTAFDGSACRGRVVLVDFWAVWCVNCYKEAPELKRLYGEHHDQGFDIVCVSLDESPEDARAYIKKAGLPDAWPTLIGATEETTGFDHPLAQRCGLFGVPFMFVMDRSGTIVSVNARGEELEATIRRLLAEEGGQAKEWAAVAPQAVTPATK